MAPALSYGLGDREYPPREPQADINVKPAPQRGCLNDLGVPVRNHIVGLSRVEIGADREFKLRKCG